MNIILIGPPGSGKSTQGKLLSEKLNIPYFSVGQILRSIAEGDSEDAKNIKKYITQGNLLPDEVVVPIVEKYITEDSHAKGFILDGFPRVFEQARDFKHDIDHVIYVSLDDKEALWRIAKRTDKRNDQSAATILHRLEVFHAQTDKVIQFYRQKGILIEVDGHPSIDDIHAEILEKLNATSL